MEIKVRVKLHASKIEVIQVSQSEYCVRLTAAPEKGKANEQLIEAIAEHLKIPKSRITILRGLTSRDKILQIN